MRGKKLGPISLNSKTTSQRPALFCTGHEVPETGIYRVTHDAHRLPHNVTLFQAQSFPRCAKCHEAVGFELLYTAPAVSDVSNSFRVYLYELPVIDESDELAVG